MTCGKAALGGGSDVYLNVYDIQTPDDPESIPKMNDHLYRVGLGVYHTAISVHGREFAFGGHVEAGISGIFEVAPGECVGVRYRTSIYLGMTALSLGRIRCEILDRLGTGEFLGTTYSLISHNCNHFSRHLAGELGLAHKFPEWPNRLANVAANLSCLIPEGVDAPIGNAVPQGSIENQHSTTSSSTRHRHAKLGELEILDIMDEPRKPPKVAALYQT